jgi:hypothetical protein
LAAQVVEMNFRDGANLVALTIFHHQSWRAGEVKHESGEVKYNAAITFRQHLQNVTCRRHRHGWERNEKPLSLPALTDSEGCRPEDAADTSVALIAAHFLSRWHARH